MYPPPKKISLDCSNVQPILNLSLRIRATSAESAIICTTLKMLSMEEASQCVVNDLLLIYPEVQAVLGMPRALTGNRKEDIMPWEFRFSNLSHGMEDDKSLWFGPFLL